MSYSSNRSSYEERQRQWKEEQAERNRIVKVCHTLYWHQTESGLLVKEGEELAGIEWKVHGREVWLPKRFVQTCTPSYNRNIERGDPVELEIPKWLADEKELVY